MTDQARPAPIQRTAASTGGWSALHVLLGLFAVCFAVATLIALGLGFDLLVPPPDLAETLDLPGRLQAIRPFREATWPFDAASTLLFVVGVRVPRPGGGPDCLPRRARRARRRPEGVDRRQRASRGRRWSPVRRRYPGRDVTCVLRLRLHHRGDDQPVLGDHDRAGGQRLAGIRRGPVWCDRRRAVGGHPRRPRPAASVALDRRRCSRPSWLRAWPCTNSATRRPGTSPSPSRPESCCRSGPSCWRCGPTESSWILSAAGLSERPRGLADARDPRTGITAGGRCRARGPRLGTNTGGRR